MMPLRPVAEIIIEAVQNADDYKWIIINKKKLSPVFGIHSCAQRCNTLKHSQKNPDPNKQRDTIPRERFDCNGTIKLHINLHHAYIHIQHNDLHIAPTDFSIPDWVKDYILQNLDLFPQVIYAQLIKQEMPTFIRQKQIHYWWSQYMTKQYKRKDDAYDSAHDWLYEKGYEIIVVNKEPARALGFITGFHKKLREQNIQINECGIDATYNTNNLTFELYILHAEVDGTGYPLGYLFLDNNGNGVSGARTNIITRFLEKFREYGIFPQFFLTDKDFAQISAGQTVWPNAKIQLCHWHLR
ncbi:unnamed protein product [Rhizophagus irregularis]|nr:unnamed protein product [Rhizophagus irregularis]